MTEPLEFGVKLIEMNGNVFKCYKDMKIGYYA